MARYVLSFSDEDDAGDAKLRFASRAQAEAEFRQIANTGMFVRLIEWGDDGQPRELARENDPNQ